MKVRIIQNFGCYERGQVFDDWPGGMCDILISRGLIEEVVEVETATEEPHVERADISPRKAHKKAK